MPQQPSSSNGAISGSAASASATAAASSSASSTFSTSSASSSSSPSPFSAFQRHPVLSAVAILFLCFNIMNVMDNRKFLKTLMHSIEVDEERDGVVNFIRQRTTQQQGVVSSADNNGTTTSAFEAIVETARQFTFRHPPSTKGKSRPQFNVKSWKQKGDGGLTDKDREMLGRIYGAATSLFEYGLGESTRIAAAVGVPVYAGIDSDPNYVANTRAQAPEHFRFYFGDIGPTRLWGFPTGNLTKSPWNYQLAPLLSEPYPFDVYMVDGRYRFPLLLASFLHAEARGESNLTRTIVLVHDCWRKIYHRADPYLDLVEKTRESEGDHLCAYRRKPDTRSSDLVRLWQQYFVEWE